MPTLDRLFFAYHFGRDDLLKRGWIASDLEARLPPPEEVPLDGAGYPVLRESVSGLQNAELPDHWRGAKVWNKQVALRVESGPWFRKRFAPSMLDQLRRVTGIYPSSTPLRLVWDALIYKATKDCLSSADLLELLRRLRGVSVLHLPDRDFLLRNVENYVRHHLTQYDQLARGPSYISERRSFDSAMAATYPTLTTMDASVYQPLPEPGAEP